MRLYYAGCEPPLHRAAVVRGGGRNIFISYFHLSSMAKSLVTQSTVLKSARDAGMRIIIDSGAFTMMQVARKAGGKAAVTYAIEKYTDEFLDWTSRMRSMFDFCVEMDVQHVVGLPRVQRWRRAFADLGLRRQLWLAYHSCDTWADLEEVVLQSRWDQGGSGYMGIEGKSHPMSYRIEYAKATTLAYRNAVCVHAFASTRPSFLKDIPVASSDSTSYQATARYGTVVKYDPLKCGPVTLINNQKNASEKVAVAANVWRLGGFGGNQAISSAEREAMVVREYVKMERAITELWQARGIDWEGIEAMHEANRRP